MTPLQNLLCEFMGEDVVSIFVLFWYEKREKMKEIPGYKCEFLQQKRQQMLTQVHVLKTACWLDVSSCF